MMSTLSSISLYPVAVKPDSCTVMEPASNNSETIFGTQPNFTLLYVFGLEDNKLIECRLELTKNDKAHPIPYKLNIAGKNFTRQFENYFVPENASPQIISAFFDSISSCYENLVDSKLSYGLNELLINVVLSKTERSSINLLDFGIGTGISSTITRNYPCITLSGFDLSDRMLDIAIAERGLSADAVTNSISKFEDAFFDAVIACNVVHYFADFKPFEEISRVLKHNGILVFNVRLDTYYPSPETKSKYISYLTAIGFAVNDAIFPLDFTHKKYKVWIITAIKNK